MKKLLFSLLACLTLFSCSKDSDVYPVPDTYNYTVDRTLNASGNNVTVIKFSSTGDLTAGSIVFKNPAEFIQSGIVYSGKTAVITTTSTVIKSYLITYTDTQAFKHEFGFLVIKPEQ